MTKSNNSESLCWQIYMSFSNTYRAKIALNVGQSQKGGGGSNGGAILGWEQDSHMKLKQLSEHM